MYNVLDDIKRLLKLILPLVFAQILASGKVFTDVVMVGNLDKNNLAALALAFNLYFTITLFSTAISSSVISVLARLKSKENIKDLNNYAQQNMYLHLLLAVIVSIFFINSNYLFERLNLSIETIKIATDYLFILGIFYILLAFRYVLRPILITYKKGNQFFYTALLGFLLNIPLNYILIYGKLGFEETGAVGSAYSTAICSLIEIAILIYYVYKKRTISVFNVLYKIDLCKIKELVKLGLPAGVGVLAEFGMFSLVLFMLTGFGESVVSGHQIASATMGFVFIVSTSLLSILNQQVSYYNGQNNLLKIKQVIFAGYFIAIGSSLITMLITVFFAQEIASLYTNNINVISIATGMILITLGYQFFDNIYLANVGILRAYKQNKYTLKVILISYWLVGFPVGYLLSNTYQGYAYWIGFIACFIVASFATSLKVYKLVWQKC